MNCSCLSIFNSVKRDQMDSRGVRMIHKGPGSFLLISVILPDILGYVAHFAKKYMQWGQFYNQICATQHNISLGNYEANNTQHYIGTKPGTFLPCSIVLNNNLLNPISLYERQMFDDTCKAALNDHLKILNNKSIWNQQHICLIAFIISVWWDT